MFSYSYKGVEQRSASPADNQHIAEGVILPVAAYCIVHSFAVGTVLIIQRHGGTVNIPAVYSKVPGSALALEVWHHSPGFIVVSFWIGMLNYATMFSFI